jgi:hypothetical protein
MQPTTGNTGKPSRVLLIAIAIILETLFISMVLIGNWREHILPFLAMYFIAFAIYLYLVIQIHRRKLSDEFKIIIAAAFLFRLTIFWSEPTLSSDIYRYIWDGKVQNAGFGPYDQTPRSSKLEFLRDKNYEKINHKDFWTAYPPAAQNMFRFLTYVSNNEYVFKAGIAIFDLLLILVLFKLIQFEKLSTAYLLIYAWHPLPIVEFGAAGHIDVVSMALMMLTLYVMQRGFPTMSGISLALATLTKYLPIVAFPWLFLRGRWKFLAGLVVVSALLFWQYYTSPKMFQGLFTFYRKWWFNDSLFRVLYQLLGGAEPARIFGGAAVLLSFIFCWIKKYPIYRSLLIVIGTIIAFSPVVHPWYICWIIPFLVFHWNSAWLFFSGWIAIAYIVIYVYPVGKWSHDDWLRILVYLPLYVMLLIGWVRGLRKSATSGGRASLPTRD